MVQGNMALRPSKDYAVQLSYIMNRKYILIAYANYSDDYFVQLPYQSSEELVLIYKTLNWDHKWTVGVNLVVPFRAWSPDMKMHYANQNLDMDNFRDSRAFILSFSYKFGGYKSKLKKDVDTSRFGQ